MVWEMPQTRSPASSACCSGYSHGPGGGKIVGDEAALTGEHRLGLGVGVVERVQHPLQRPRELRDLVVGLR